MKSLLLTLGLALCSSLASAGNSCIVEMRSYNGQVIEKFNEFRCADATYKCERELENRNRYGRNRFAECVVASRPEEAPEWVLVDEVRFTDRKTAVAISNCKAARAVDFRCNDTRNYQCGVCSEKDHSDESIYKVHQLIANGGRGNGGGYGPGRGHDGPGRGGDYGPGRGNDGPGRGNDGPGRGGSTPAPRTPVREFVKTFDFFHKKTAEARKECERQRASTPQCNQPGQYECTPCTIESHTDHSKFDLYRITYR